MLGEEYRITRIQGWEDVELAGGGELQPKWGLQAI